MGPSSVIAMKEVVCKLWVSISFGEKIGREVVSLLFERGSMLEKSNRVSFRNFDVV